MTHRNQDGFTLIELIVVIAISGALFTAIFAGQAQMRDRSRFNAAIQETMQQIEYTRNYALSNINPAGQGNALDTEVIGTAFEIDEAHAPGKLTELEPVYQHLDANGNPTTLSVMPQSGVCPDQQDGECYEHYFNTSVALKVPDAAEGEVLVLFLNKPSGLVVCGWQGDMYISFDDMCSSANPGFGSPVDIRLVDDAGHEATIRVDNVTGAVKLISD